MERLLKIFLEVSSSTTPAQDATSMVVNLLPHFLGTAIPMALLLGIIITVDRFSRTSELTAAFGSGVSLFHLTKPFLVLAGILMAVSFLVEGFLMPHGRYEYRNTIYKVRVEGTAAAMKQGTVTRVGNRTFYAGTNMDGDAKGPIFIHERIMKDGEQTGSRVTTAAKGRVVIREDSRQVIVQLADGKTYQVTSDLVLDGQGEFGSSAFSGAIDMPAFRARGNDNREMTTAELFQNRDGTLNDRVPPEENNAAFHFRVAKSVLLLILPFIAVPFGLNYGRNPSAAGIFLGVVFIVALEKALEFGQSLGADGVIPAWLGIWPIVLLVALMAAALFYKSAFKMGQPPLTTITFWAAGVLAWFKKDIKETAKTLLEETVS